MANPENYWTRRTLGRRSMLQAAGIAGTGVAGLALVGCGDDDDSTGDGGSSPVAVSTPRAAESSTAQAAVGGFITSYGTPGFTYQNIDPHATIFTSPFTHATHSLLAYLDDSAASKTDWKTMPDAAASWETPDPTTYIFHLRDGLKFHNLPPANGRAATSEDVKFSLERIGMADPRFFRQNEFKRYGMQVTTPDAKTVILKSPKPFATFWSKLTTPGTVILPKEVGTTVIVSTDPLAGTGPFMHKEFVPDRTFITVRNPDYFIKGKPYLDEVRSIGSGTDSAEKRLVAFKAKDVDRFTVGNLDQWTELKNTTGVVTDRRVTNQSQWVIFNTKKAPFSDPRVRKAISLATPRQEIVDIAHRGEEDGVMQGPGGLNPFLHGLATWPYDELKKRPGYRSGKDRDADLTTAKQLLQAAGVTSYSGTLKYTSQTTGWPYADTLATLLQEAYKSIGFDLKLQPFSYADTLVNLPTLDWEIYYSPQYANGTDPNDYLDIYFRSGATRNYSKWENEKYNTLFDQQDSAGAEAERNTLIRQMLEILDEENPRAGVTIWTSKVAWWDHLHGYYNSSLSQYSTYEHNWWVKKA